MTDRELLENMFNDCSNDGFGFCLDEDLKLMESCFYEGSQNRYCNECVENCIQIHGLNKVIRKVKKYYKEKK